MSLELVQSKIAALEKELTLWRQLEHHYCGDDYFHAPPLLPAPSPSTPTLDVVKRKARTDSPRRGTRQCDKCRAWKGYKAFPRKTSTCYDCGKRNALASAPVEVVKCLNCGEAVAKDRMARNGWCWTCDEQRKANTGSRKAAIELEPAKSNKPTPGTMVNGVYCFTVAEYHKYKDADDCWYPVDKILPHMGDAEGITLTSPTGIVLERVTREELEACR
ncbi:MAG: hypothetical protein AMXMBFR84_26240 [Candidatus Hydrogenedentota bacterium]